MRELTFLTETWLPCVGNDLYEVSDLGRVRSIDRYIMRKGLTPVKGKILVPKLNKKGYPSVVFHINGKALERNPHRLVAEAFIPNPENKPQVNHINGIKTDCRAVNLEWTTNSENQLHAYRLGLQPSRAGENNIKAKVTNIIVTKFKTEYNSGRSIKSISVDMGIPIEIFRNIIYGRTWKTHTMKILKRDERSKPKNQC